MAITINQKPYALQGSRNPVEFKTTTDKYITAAATLFYATYTFDSTMATNDTLTFAFGAFSVTFTVVATPDDSGKQITTPGALTVVQWLPIVVADIEKNFLMSSYFTFLASASDIEVTARDNGTAFNITLTKSSETIITINETLATDTVYSPNFSIYYDIFTKYTAGTDYLKRYSGSKIPDADQVTWFNVAEILDDYLSLAYRPARSLVFQKKDTLLYYKITFTELYGSPPDYHAVAEGSADELFVIKGGFNHLDFPAKRDMLDNVSSLIADMSYTRHVTETQDVFLSYVDENMVEDLVSTIDLELWIDIFWDDGTQTLEKLTGYQLTNPEEMGIFNVGFTSLSLAAYDPTKTVVRYNCTIYTLSSPSGGTFSFILTESSAIDKELHFRNSLGAYESIRLFGQQAYGIELSFDEIKKILPPNYTTADFDRDHTEHEIEHKYTVSSGQFPTLKALMGSIDVLLSDDVFFYDDDDRQVKILIKKGKFKIKTDDSGFMAFQFSYSPAYTDKNYS